jgi:predicted RNase H-like nuclease
VNMATKKEILNIIKDVREQLRNASQMIDENDWEMAYTFAQQLTCAANELEYTVRDKKVDELIATFNGA